LLLLACSGASTPAPHDLAPVCAVTAVAGVLQGRSIAQIAGQGFFPADNNNPYLIGHISDNTAAGCGKTLADYAGTHFGFQVGKQPGHYGPSDNFFFAVLTHLSAPSMGDLASYADSGGIDVAAVSPRLQGTFDLGFQNERLTGCFDLPACP
jgi:hypothetical protein